MTLQISILRFAILFLCLAKGGANASFYVRHWHKDSHLSASYNTRQTRQRRTLASYRLDNAFSTSRTSRGYGLGMRLNSTPPRSFDRKKPSEKIVVGTVQVLVDSLEDYLVGFGLGFVVGATLSLPTMIFRSTKERAGSELGSRSMAWAMQTGTLLGSCRGCATTVRLVRSPKRDNWNIVYGCASAGAFMARYQGPTGMATSALIWGAVIYLLENKTNFRPISRHRENVLSPFRSETRRSQLGLM